MQIHGGTTNLPADVTTDNRLIVDAVSETYAALTSRQSGRAYSVVAIDAGPVAAEYTLYLQNISSEKNFIIDQIVTSQVDADVIWKLHEVTGTASGTSITPSNLNLGSARTAADDLNAIGGAAGVTGLTSVEVMYTWMGGNVYSSYTLDTLGTLILCQNDAIAIEYDAGTGGACGITIIGHQYPW